MMNNVPYAIFFVGLHCLNKYIFTTMNLKLLLFALLLPCCLSAFENLPGSSQNDTLNVATYNVRIRTSGDTHERSWDNRKPHIAGLIRNHQFDIIGVQELIDNQQEQELSSLLTGYAVFSTGRDNTQATEGERIAIYYLKHRFTVIDQGYFFLSETPDKASKGWDAALNRMCNWLYLKDNISGKKVYIFNTHFDHIGKEAREGSAKLLIEKIHQIAGDAPVICMGDFNANPSEIRVYQTMTSKLYDSRTVAQSASEKSIGTFNGWKHQTPSLEENLRIDYIFTNFKKIACYGVINDFYQPGAYPSDHFPVFVKLVLP